MVLSLRKKERIRVRQPLQKIMSPVLNNKVKKQVEAIKDLVPNANWECSSSGINVQAMDSSHVSLVSISLEADGFEPYRCDRNVILGMETANLSKILKCASNDDSITIKAEEGGDMVTFQFDSQSKYYLKISMP